MNKKTAAFLLAVTLCLCMFLGACTPDKATDPTTTTSTSETTTLQTEDQTTTATDEGTAVTTQKATSSDKKTNATATTTTAKKTVTYVKRTTTTTKGVTTQSKETTATTASREEKTSTTVTTTTAAKTTAKTTVTTTTTATTTTKPTVPTIPAPSDMAKMEETLDVIVDVESGRDPIVLQLTDPQIMDQANSGGLTTEEKCYQYLREIITETNPDLILVTGDLVYGRFDADGSLLKEFIAFMESFKIPWAPTYGNHDTEQPLGKKWLYEQLEAAEYCCFKKGTVSGYGNYTVGIRQGNALTRVFFMMDSRGHSDGTLPVGFASNQIKWYKEVGNTIKTLSPQTKLSFAFHIQLSVFAEAFAQYGYTEGSNVNIDAHSDKKDGDFGFIGRGLKDSWDADKKVWTSFKDLGVDSVFVGHEHSNSASIVYQGIRLQYGQKSSTYDRYNTTNGARVTAATWSTEYGHVPVIGGTVMTLADGDGTITDSHIYYCKQAGGQYDWSTIR